MMTASATARSVEEPFAGTSDRADDRAVPVPSISRSDLLRVGLASRTTRAEQAGDEGVDGVLGDA